MTRFGVIHYGESMAAYFCRGETTITTLAQPRGTELRVGKTGIINVITIPTDIAGTGRTTKRLGKINGSPKLMPETKDLRAGITQPMPLTNPC